jgi:hypothetical protein
MALRLIPRSLRRSGFFVTVPGAKRQLCHPVHASVEALKPRGFVVRETSAFVLCAVPRPSHPAPNVRDDRDTPLMVGTDARKNASDLPDVTSELPATQ